MDEKEVKLGRNEREKMMRGVDIIDEDVKVKIGKKGRNVVIEK